MVANGVADGPAQALRDFLLMREARQVTTVFHPLDRLDPGKHIIRRYERGQLVHERTVPAPSRPPFTYPFDLVIPPRVPPADVWFGFNSLCTARGLLERRLGRAGKVVHWCVDFVPDRFGGSPLTKVYDALDRYCCRRTDVRFELSDAALTGRNARHGVAASQLAPAQIVPMGAWLDRVVRVSPEAFSSPKVVYLGHLVPRQGVQLLIAALDLLARRGHPVRTEIIGAGPLLDELKADAVRRDIDSLVHFHGFVEDYREVERILGGATIAVAPYEDQPDSFTRFADPGKLKGYLAAGLPIVLTDVPPNAQELSSEAGALVVPSTPEGIAAGIEDALSDAGEWSRRSALARDYSRRFDWNTVFEDALSRIGFGPEGDPVP